MTTLRQTEEQLPLFYSPMDAKNADIDVLLLNARLQRAEAVSALIGHVTSFVKNFFRTRKMVRTLDNLSDAVLADIGVERSQIPSISRALAEGTYYENVAEAPSATVTEIVINDADTIENKQADLPLAA